MANNKSTANINLRDVSADWFFQEFWHSPTRPSDVLHHEYTKTLMNLAEADGILADEERKWILGNLAAKGGNEEMHNYFKTYMPTKTDLEATIKERPNFTKVGSRSVLFDAFQAASADNDLHKDEREAIYRMGRAMGIEDVVLQQIELAAAKEKAHRREVVALLFPQGLQQACNIAETDFEKNPA